MDAVVHHVSAWDGLPLLVREWGDSGMHPPLLCLPGLVRTGGDFASLAATLATERRVVALDYPGRGGSGRARDVCRYAPEACIRDVLDVCAALHVRGAIGVGTSFGGLLCMALAVTQRSLLRGVVLNDIGPEIGERGAEFVRWFVATDPALPNLGACVGFLKSVLPVLSLRTEDDWQAMARLTYAPDPHGVWRPLWDTRIAGLLRRRTPDLWTLFGGLQHLPLLLIRGEESDILLPTTLARMRATRPDMEVVSVPGVGHAPTLGEADVAGALGAFLRSIG